jgi:hypothetical protein
LRESETSSKRRFAVGWATVSEYSQKRVRSVMMAMKS